MTAARTTNPTAHTHDDRRGPAPAVARHTHRERAFGIGYGNSSGYGREKHYVREWNQGLFRFR